MTSSLQKYDYTCRGQELPCRQSSEPTVVYLICFRGVDPQGGKIIQFSEKQSVNVKVTSSYQEGDVDPN